MMSYIENLEQFKDFDLKPIPVDTWVKLGETCAKFNDDYTNIIVEANRSKNGETTWRFTIEMRRGGKVTLTHCGKIHEHLKTIEAIAIGNLSICIET